MKIVFMGTPEFSIPSLRELADAGYEIAGVVTAPDKPAGRGRKLTPPPVKEYAVSRGFKVLQPVKLKNPEFLEAFAALEPDLAVVVAFRKLPKVVWSLPRIGTFNLHASLLPDYRGAAPINWALINGETETGATTFFIDEKIDTGALLMQTRFEIPWDWNAGDLHDHMMEEGAKLVLETVRGLEAGQLEAKAQDPAAFLHPAPKIFKDTCRIDWQQPAETLYNFIRGLSPYPGAWTLLNEQSLKIFRAVMVEGPVDLPPGTLRLDGNRLRVATGEGWLSLEALQIQGKRRMELREFLNGFKGDLSKLV